jgi:hypothetical protein
MPKDDIITELRKHKFYYNPKGSTGKRIRLSEPWWQISPEAQFNEETETVNCFTTSSWVTTMLQGYGAHFNDDRTMDIKLVDLYIHSQNDTIFSNIQNEKLRTLLDTYQPYKLAQNISSSSHSSSYPHRNPNTRWGPSINDMEI